VSDWEATTNSKRPRSAIGPFQPSDFEKHTPHRPVNRFSLLYSRCKHQISVHTAIQVNIFSHASQEVYHRCSQEDGRCRRRACAWLLYWYVSPRHAVALRSRVLHRVRRPILTCFIRYGKGCYHQGQSMFSGASRPPHLVSRRLPPNMSAKHNKASSRSVTCLNTFADLLYARSSSKNVMDQG
jgi:hypothetical protein